MSSNVQLRQAARRPWRMIAEAGLLAQLEVAQHVRLLAAQCCLAWR